MDKRILIVDDEIQIIRALTRAFMDTEYEIYSALSGQEALEVLESTEVDLVLSDMRMPNMDGYQLLCQIKEKYPAILRVILSGYSDESLIFKALQRNVAKLYIFKPWENHKLIKLIDQMFETEELLKNTNLLTVVSSLEALPTIKTSYQNILKSIDDNMEIDDIAQQIEHDQAIVAKLLQIVNSAYYGVKIGSIKHAITYLGLANVRNLIISTSIISSIDVHNIPGKDLKLFWDHAFITNKIVTIIYQDFLNKRLSKLSMVAGLLHNIGVVFHLYMFKGEYLKCFNDAKNEGIDILEVEKAKFGVDHQKTGGYLLKWWELPYPIVEATLYHHDPFNKNIINQVLLSAVHIAEWYAWVVLEQKPESNFMAEAFEVLGIKQGEFEEKILQSNSILRKE